MSIRVRFAPSPTGPLHIGGIRTALFNYLFAKKNKGDFILRIEDTDKDRKVDAAEKYIIESLKWLKIFPNEGVGTNNYKYKSYRQSKRHCYQKPVQFLCNKGFAYYAFDTPEELELLRKQSESEGKTFQYDWSVRNSLKNSLTLNKTETKRKIALGIPYVIRFKIPENNELHINDLIRGRVDFQTSILDDKVLFKADGLPTYHLANVVDDYLMKITHVIRGEEWLSSLPLHVLLYNAFGWGKEMPQFAHLPLILKPSGQGKLSKRDGDKMGFPVFPLQWTDPATGEISSGYRESGYFPEAVINILAFLGWNPGGDQEIFSLDELVDAFSLDRVGKAGSRFDHEKAKWYNQQYLREKSNEELKELFLPILHNEGIKAELSTVDASLNLVKERAVSINDLWNQSRFVFIAPKEYDAVTVEKIWKKDSMLLMGEIIQILNGLVHFTPEEVEKVIKDYAFSHQVGMGKIMNPLRLLLVGSSYGPHLTDIITLLGKQETVKRIENGIAALKGQ